MLIVDSGALTIRVEEHDWTIPRGAALQQAMSGSGEDISGIFEAVAIGDEGTFEVGDVAFIAGSVNGEVRNDGQEPAGGIIFLVAPGGMLGEVTAATSTPQQVTGANLPS